MNKLSKIVDLTGERFGMLTAIEPIDKRNNDGNVIWKCKCDCGQIAFVVSSHLISKHTKSCGCLRKKMDSNKYAKYLVDGTNITYLTQKVRKNNTSGEKGISWNKEKKKYEASIRLKGKKYYLGRYNNIDDAIEARKQAEKELFEPIIEEFNSKVGD